MRLLRYFCQVLYFYLGICRNLFSHVISQLFVLPFPFIQTAFTFHPECICLGINFSIMMNINLIISHKSILLPTKSSTIYNRRGKSCLICKTVWIVLLSISHHWMISTTIKENFYKLPELSEDWNLSHLGKIQFIRVSSFSIFPCECIVLTFVIVCTIIRVHTAYCTNY